MQVHMLPVSGPHGVTCHVHVLEIAPNSFLCIDPHSRGIVEGQIRPFMEQRPDGKIRYILLTHYHMDHIGGTSLLLTEPYCADAELICHPRVAQTLKDPSIIIAETKLYLGDDYYEQVYAPVDPIPPEKHDRFIEVTGIDEGSAVASLGADFSFIALPGHTFSDIALLHRPSKSFFPGDSLGIFFGGSAHLPVYPPAQFSPDDLVKSLDRFSEMGDDVSIVYFAHNGPMKQEEGEEKIVDRIVNTLRTHLPKFVKKVQEVKTELEEGAGAATSADVLKSITERVIGELMDDVMGPKPTPEGEDDPRMPFRITFFLSAAGVVEKAFRDIADE